MSKAIARTLEIEEEPARPAVAVVLAGGLLIVTAFQVALTFGAPLGAAALRKATGPYAF